MAVPPVRATTTLARTPETKVLSRAHAPPDGTISTYQPMNLNVWTVQTTAQVSRVKMAALVWI